MLSARASWENTFLTIGLLIATKHCSTWTNYQKYQNNNLVFHQVFHKAAKSPVLCLCAFWGEFQQLGIVVRFAIFLGKVSTCTLFSQKKRFRSGICFQQSLTTSLKIKSFLFAGSADGDISGYQHWHDTGMLLLHKSAKSKCWHPKRPSRHCRNLFWTFIDITFSFFLHLFWNGHFQSLTQAPITIWGIRIDFYC